MYVCIISIILATLSSTALCEEGNSANLNPNPTLFYKEHQIRTEQLCPDLQESTKSRDLDTANFPYKSVFKLVDQVWRTADPCIFESRGARNQYTTVVIKAIHADNLPWNYSGAQPCSEHIKLRLPNRRIFSRAGLPICTIRKPTNPAKLFQGPFYHPHVWQLSKQKMGISFSIYENDTAPPHSKDGDDEDDDDGSTENNEISQSNGFLLNAKLPKFVHIVFASFYGDTCSLRVQQYIVDPTREHCNASTGRFYSLCGMYNCSEEERVLKQAGFWSDSLRISEMQKFIDFMRTKQYRQASEPSIMDFFVNLMRLMIMPMVFLVAYYVTRQLREKLANRQLLLQLRSQNNTIAIMGVGRGSRVGISNMPVIIDSPSSSRRERFEDPPPSYETTLITPPTYLEAISFKTINDAVINKLELNKSVFNAMSSLPSTSFTNANDNPLVSQSLQENQNENQIPNNYPDAEVQERISSSTSSSALFLQNIRIDDDNLPSYEMRNGHSSLVENASIIQVSNNVEEKVGATNPTLMEVEGVADDINRNTDATVINVLPSSSS